MSRPVERPFQRRENERSVPLRHGLRQALAGNDGVAIDRHGDERIAEAWLSPDSLAILTQLDVLPEGVGARDRWTNRTSRSPDDRRVVTPRRVDPTRPAATRFAAARGFCGLPKN
ncbi:hypothetical protein [Halorarum salinum]|uniref:Uncharacterized protein n=1 Tax=Halorarum salinum TaxID=2743089 RepID=A0A7D5QAJ1_9EURY|nr:hypothetical protein [Halobaculum salinum]QLG62457.1 hypothetical protein HUG12_12245 [Halobaculum salinum]